MEIIAATDHIHYVKALVSEDWCRQCIALYEADPQKHPGRTTKAEGQTTLESDVKVSTDLDLGTEGEWAPLFSELHTAVTSVVQSIAAQYPALQVAPLRCTGYKIQRYRQDEGQFKWHMDAFGPGGWDRQLAMVLYLNTVQSGGETTFHRQALKANPVAGNALFFPPFWTHLHCAEIPRSGDKYIVSSFIRFDLPDATPGH